MELVFKGVKLLLKLKFLYVGFVWKSNPQPNIPSPPWKCWEICGRGQRVGGSLDVLTQHRIKQSC